MNTEYEKMPRFEPQELDRDDYLLVQIGASAVRGAVYGLAGGALMTLGVYSIGSSKAKNIIKLFCGTILGANGLSFAALSFTEWRNVNFCAIRLAKNHFEKLNKNT